jgi:hypothetical protein
MNKFVLIFYLITSIYACNIPQQKQMSKTVCKVKDTIELKEIQDKIAESMAMDIENCSSISKLLTKFGQESKTQQYWHKVYNDVSIWFCEDNPDDEVLEVKKHRFHFNIWKISGFEREDCFLMNETTKEFNHHGYSLHFFVQKKGILIEKDIADNDIGLFSDSTDVLSFGKIDSIYQKDNMIIALCEYYDHNDQMRNTYVKKIFFKEDKVFAEPYLIGDSLNYSIFVRFCKLENNRHNFENFSIFLEKVVCQKNKKIYFIKIPYEENLSRTEISENCIGGYVMEEDINTEEVKVIGEIPCLEVKESTNWKYEKTKDNYPIVSFRMNNKKVVYAYENGFYCKE